LCLAVRDSKRQALAYIFFEDEPGRRSTAKLRIKDEARRMAVSKCPMAMINDATSVVHTARLEVKPTNKAPRLYVAY
jgi:hypothetical protein